MPYSYNGENDVITFSRLFSIKSFSYLQVIRTCIKAWMSSNFCQIPQLTPGLSALVHLKNLCIMLLPLLSAFSFDRIFIIFVGKEDSHKSLDEFEFRPNPVSNCELAALKGREKSP